MKLMRTIFSALVLGVFCCLLLQPAPSKADTLTWILKKTSTERVHVEFYSQNRKHEWPSNGQAYAFYDNRSYRIVLECIPGERICFGGWVQGNPGKYWGVGRKNSKSCHDCCYYCAGVAERRQLID